MEKSGGDKLMNNALHLVGLGLLVFEIPVGYSSVLARLLIAMGIILSLLNTSNALKYIDAFKTVVLVFLFFCMSSFFGILLGAFERPSLVIDDLLRQIFMVLFVFSMYVQFKTNRQALRYLLVWVYLILLLHLLLYIWVGVPEQLLGLKFDGYSSKYFKSDVREHYNIPLNALVPSTLFYMVLLFVLSKGVFLKKTIAFVLIVSSIFLPLITGVRTMIFVVFLTFILFIFTNFKIIKKNAMKNMFTWLYLFGFSLSYVVLVFNPYVLDSSVLAQMTTGRTELWVAGIKLHIENVIFGVGAHHSLFDLFQYLELFGSEHIQRFEKITGGAMHSIWFSVLAERGLLSFVVQVCVWLFIFRSMLDNLRYAYQLKIRKKYLSVDIVNIKVMASAIFGMFVLSFSESFGVFGYSNSPIDFTSYIMILAGITLTGKEVAEHQVKKEYLRNKVNLDIHLQ